MSDWLWEVFVRPRRGLSHVHVGSLHAAGRRDGAAQRPRRLHPPPGGCLDLGGAVRRRSPRAARTRRTASSTRPPTRSTGTRRSTRCPMVSSTCDRRRSPSRLRRSPLADDALIAAQRLGEWIARAPQLEEDVALGNIALDLLGQARLLLTYAGAARGPARRGRPGLPPRRARLPQRASSSSGRTATSPSRWPGCCCSRPTSASSTPAGARPTRPWPRVAAKAVKEVDYHRDHATPVGAAARRRHRRVAPPDAGGARRRVALRAELFDADLVDAGLRAAASPSTRRAARGRRWRGSTPCSPRRR